MKFDWLSVLISPTRWTLSAKLCAGLALAALAGLALGALALHGAIRPAFAALEEDALAQQVARSETLLENARSAVQSSATDYAVWDDSYNYLTRPNRQFEQQNLTVLGLVNLEVDAIAYARTDGTLLHALFVDREAEAADRLRSSAFGALVTDPRFRELARSRSAFSEFVRLDGRLYAVGAAQVLRSDGSGVSPGYVVMARELSNAFVSDALQTRARVTENVSTQTSMAPDYWHAVVAITDVGGARIGALEYDAPRDITKLGAVAIGSALVASSVVMIGVLLAVLLLMRIVVARRLETVTGHVRRVAADGVLAPLAPDAAGDELGSLNRSFNAMIAQLHELREQVKEQSFLLGQSDVAASVIHNVRNSLNPVSVIIAQTLAEKPAIRAEDAERALRELRAGEASPQRRKQLADFLLEGLNEIGQRAGRRGEALVTARAALSEALEILRLQNEAAARDIPLERFDVLDLIKRNAAVARFAPSNGTSVEIPSTGAAVVANPLLLSQVVANLMTNALESILAYQPGAGRVAISLTPVGCNGEHFVMIGIEDNGGGFEPGDTARLFERGQSSKPGSCGLGLHWCANTVRAMGGSLALVSKGAGQGARAEITLPAAMGGGATNLAA